MFSRFYQDELAYLRELGGEFARTHPDVAHMLLGPGGDPDVERLLEGTAFLTGRIRAKLEDELPELTHTLLQVLYPHYLRPVPAMAIQEFRPVAGTVRDRLAIPAGAEVDSVPVSGTRCRFRTTAPVDLYPLTVAETAVEPSGTDTLLRVRLRVSRGATLAQVPLEKLRFFLHGPAPLPATLLYWFHRKVRSVGARTVVPAAAREVSLPAGSIHTVGFDPSEALLPYPAASFDGYRVLQEYLVLEERFHFVDLAGLGALRALGEVEAVDLLFVLAGRLDPPQRIGPDNLRLGCAPVVNLFPHPADPISLDHTRVEYRVRPSGKDPQHFEVFSVDRVEGVPRGGGVRRPFRPYVESLEAGTSPEGRRWYETRLRPAVVGEGTETWLAFSTPARGEPDEEVVSIDLACTHRGLPAQLRVGDVRLPTSRSPSSVQMSNLTAPTRSFPPPLGTGLLPRLIGHLSLSQRSLASAGALRTLLNLYDFAAVHDAQAREVHGRRIAGIADVTAEGSEWLVRGSVVRGSTVRLTLDEAAFGGEGEMFLLGSVLDRFLARWVTMNSFSRLEVKGAKRREVWSWPPRLGDLPLL